MGKANGILLDQINKNLRIASLNCDPGAPRSIYLSHLRGEIAHWASLLSFGPHPSDVGAPFNVLTFLDNAY